MSTAAAIRRAIDHREVYIAYQPIVDLRAGNVFAYEALARSHAPEFAGPLPLFQAAVEARVTGELGRLLREIAVANLPDERLFINIHPAELNEGWLVQPSDPLYDHDKEVYLEITEGVPLSHFALCQTILKEVRGRGVHLVVDDLGAGYSNLKYIADLNPRVVKLDRDLIAGLTLDTRLFKLVQAICVLCQDLGALVVAEGIETITELQAVREAGAEYGQGYLLARPAFPRPTVEWPEEAETFDERKTRTRTGKLRRTGSLARLKR